MADVDEDVIRPLQAGVDNHDGDEDGEDDTCDFRFLSSLNLTTAATGALPKRGIKDFEPHPTSLQVNTLAASRQAMREALSHTRMHLPKNHVLGVYNAKTGLTRVKQVKGQMFRNIGKDVSGGGVDLLPEEALWALERGSLDIRWDSGDEHGEEEGLPMSLQGAYAAFIGEEEEGRGHITIEKYQVYAGLKRVGYTVLRSEEWDGEAENTQDLPRTHESSKTSALFSWLQSLFVGGKPSTRASLQRAGPLVRPGLFRSYEDEIYLMLSIISSQNVALQMAEPALLDSHVKGLSDRSLQNPFRTTWNIYKSNLAFRKSAPPPPSFRVCVVSARDTSVPTLCELSSLLSGQPCDVSISGSPGSSNVSGGVGGVYTRLKSGAKNVLIAVVDEGIVSYIRWADSAFSREKMYERGLGSARLKGGNGHGRGGHTRGRGRGR